MNADYIAGLEEAMRLLALNDLDYGPGRILKRIEQMKADITKEQWINEVYLLLCQSQGAPENDNEVKNLKDWAASLAEPESAYFQEGLTPKEAHDEEMSCS